MTVLAVIDMANPAVINEAIWVVIAMANPAEVKKVVYKTDAADQKEASVW